MSFEKPKSAFYAFNLKTISKNYKYNGLRFVCVHVGAFCFENDEDINISYEYFNANINVWGVNCIV